MNSEAFKYNIIVYRNNDFDKLYYKGILNILHFTYVKTI
jgi:hypothetical protein